MRRRLIDLGAAPERTHVVPLIADLALSHSAPKTDGARPSRVLMAGRFVEKKGFADGVGAFAKAMPKSAPLPELVIVGAGPEESRMRSIARSAGVESRVEFIPPQPRDAYRRIMGSCQIFLQPSKTGRDGDSEGGAPVTLLDAQAIGLIVVATDHADIPFVVDPDAAFLSSEGEIDALAAGLTEAIDRSDEWEQRSQLEEACRVATWQGGGRKAARVCLWGRGSLGRSRISRGARAGRVAGSHREGDSDQFIGITCRHQRVGREIDDCLRQAACAAVR